MTPVARDPAHESADANPPPVGVSLLEVKERASSLSIALAEFIGTFVVVFAGTGAIVVNATSQGAVTHVGVSLVFGLAVMSMIYAVGDISGAHLNPAVTLGFVALGRLNGRRLPLYVASQCMGAIVASACVRLIFGDIGHLGATFPIGSAGQSLALELILTFILMFTILRVAHGPKEQGILAGIAIGGVVGLEALFAGPICGASMNPARSLGPAVISGEFRSLWIYLLAPVCGALLAVLCVRGMQSEKMKESVHV